MGRSFLCFLHLKKFCLAAGGGGGGGFQKNFDLQYSRLIAV